MAINKKCKTNFFLKLSICFGLSLALFLLPKISNKARAAEDDEFCYLSDIQYDSSQSRSGYGTFLMDKAGDNSLISVKIEGGYYSFPKGIWAHATSTLVYNLTDYDYDYFTAYLGLNKTSGGGNGVKFAIYTSSDGKNWNKKTEEIPEVSKPGDDAIFVKIDIRDEKYLKLVADANGSNGNDHSVYADAKLIKATYKEPGEDLVPSIDELDVKIKEFAASNANLETNPEYEYTLLKRELINNVGNYALRKFLSASQENQDTFRWLIGDKDNYQNLKLYVLGGKPDAGSYYNSLVILSNLYKEYSDDFNNIELLNNPTYPNMTYGELYRKMAMSIALTHTQRVGLWMQNSSKGENNAEPLRRYAIFKYLHKNGKFKVSNSMDMTHQFEDLHIVEMRILISNAIDDESILWLNKYVQDNVNRNPNNVWRYITPHPYIAYVWPNYSNDVYYNPDNVDYFNQLFSIDKSDDNIGTELVDANGEGTGKVGLFDSEFVIPGGKNVSEYRLKVSRGDRDYKLYKVWMNFRNKFGTGCVCGGISKSGTNIRGTHGIPAMVVGQPGHAALLFYTKDTEGRGYWRIDNDVSGWTATGGGGRLLGWGSGSWAKGFSTGVYMEFEQAAVNDFDNLVKAEELVMLAKVYNKDLTDETNKQATLTKQEEIYRKALEKQRINFDAWIGLINTYNANEAKTEADYYNLAEEVAETLKYFPLPMYNATNLIKSKLTSSEYIYRFTLLQTRILNEAKVLPNNTETSFTVMQPGVTRLEAGYLLGQLDQNIATFSFDGEDAGKIKLASRFDENGVRWDYCLTGKGENTDWSNASWTEVSFSADEKHELQLTPEEIKSITAENDIYIHIVGVNYNESNLFKIDITEQDLPTLLYANDLENKIMGTTDVTEWRYTENDSWKSYKTDAPDLTGNKTIQLRQAATGTKLASDLSEVYTFTEDNQPDTRKYIPIKHLSIHSYSTQSTDNSRPYFAENAIDGNRKTMWHTDFSKNVLQQSIKPFIVVELDEPKNISALEFAQNKWRDSDPVYAKNVIVYISNDGETWVEVGRIENCEQNLEFKEIEISGNAYGKYVKVETETYGMFSSIAMINLFEDTTKVTHACFSFNGEESGKIILLDEFKGQKWEYSLDGGETWKNGTSDSYKLTETELQQLSAENNITVRINGKESIIDISNQEAPVIEAYLSDLENRLIGITNIENLEWKIEGDNTWTAYSEKEPIVSGDKKLLIRKKSVSTLLPSEAVEFIFTEDNQPDTAKYVSIKHLSVKSFSSTTPNRGEEATKAIDALPNTMWHTNRTITTDEREIVIELDEPKYISKIEYVKKNAYLYGILRDGLISVSMDGENWEVAQSFEDLYNVTTVAELTESENSRDITFSEPKQAKYIKIKCTKSYDYLHGKGSDGNPMDYFLSAAMFNIYEDITKTKRPTAEIEYSTEKLTNKDVTATLVNENMDITVTNNDGNKTYTFTENGEFTFEFVNEKGIKGTATAKVDWIDKTMPSVSIEYSTEAPTNGNVTATITFDKTNVTITNNDGKNTYTFTENGTFEFEFRDEAGNEGKGIAKVDWIDKTAPIATIEYSAEYNTNQDIVATITFNKENVTIINNDGKNTYTFTENGTFEFEFRDEAGNTGTATATVSNINKDLPVPTITYNINEKTNQNVTVSVRFVEENVTITNNNGNNTHTFTENGEFTFEYKDGAGNTGIIITKVDWIDRVQPIGTINYNINNKLTSQDVIATITFNKENVRITNNDGKDTYTFTENGEFTFKFIDEAGNEGTATAKVEWIDKTLPVAKLSYDITDVTNKDVTATVTFDEPGVVIINDEGEEIENGHIHVFTENGTHEFKYRGPAGNEGSVIANVTWIDKKAPVATLSYDINDMTNQDVTVTITFTEDGVTITNNGGNNTYTFTENGTFEFEFRDEVGNIGTAKAIVNWIDKIAPTANIKYSTTNETNENVIATLIDASEEITITNNDGKDTYTFTENGEFTFEFRDKVGNEGKVTATVSWITKGTVIEEAKISSKTYIISEESISRIPKQTTVKEFKQNIEANRDITIIDTKGNILKDEDIIATGMKLKLGEEKEYTVVVTGDINGNGKITITDVAKLKLHIVEKEILTDINFMAADMNGDGKLTVTDLAQIKLAFISL